MKPHALALATSFDEAHRLIAGADAKAQHLPRGAAIDLFDRMKEGLDSPSLLVSLLGIPGADRIATAADGGLEIGAAARIRDIAEHPVVRAQFSAVADAAASLATPAIRNAATLGGNLCQRPRCAYFRSQLHVCTRKHGDHCFAIPGDHRFHAIFDNAICDAIMAPTTAVPLAALGATVHIVGAGNAARSVPIERFFIRATKDPTREVDLAEGELVTHVVLPALGLASAHHAIRHRESFDWPVAEAAVSLRRTGDRADFVRIFLGSVAMVPWSAPATEEALVGIPWSDDVVRKAARRATANATPHPGTRYKLDILVAAVERALHAAWERASRIGSTL